MISKNKIKYIKSLELKKNRNKEGKFVAEGHKVVDDLLVLQPASLIVATEEWLKDKSIDPRTEVVMVSEEELRKVSFLQHPQQVLAVFDQRDNRDFASANVDFNCLNLALDGVQDPGNLGTIIRVADWFGVGAIWCSPDTADCWNPKVVQATMGSIARVAIHYAPLVPLIDALDKNCPVYTTQLDGENIYETTLKPHGVIVMGNEGNGVTEEVRRRATRPLLIPNFPQGRTTAESLNVAIATALVLGEFRRRMF